METKHMTAADRIRAALKTAGFNARAVTVREPHYGSVTVTVRDASVKLSAVEAVANPFEKVSRCESTGEILLGGNTYVDVKYHVPVLAPLKAAILALLETSKGHEVTVGPLVVSADPAGWDAKVWKHEGSMGSYYCTGLEHGAERLAVELLNLGVTELAAAKAA